MISIFGDVFTEMAVLHGLRDNGYSGQVAVTAHSFKNADQLKDAGADNVLMPYAHAAAEAVDSMFRQ